MKYIKYIKINQMINTINQLLYFDSDHFEIQNTFKQFEDNNLLKFGN